MAKTIRTKTIGEVREIRRTTRIIIESPVGAPVMVHVQREEMLADASDAIISRAPSGSFSRTMPDVYAQTITLPNGGPTLTAAQVALAVEMFCEKWDEEHLASLAPPAP